MLPLPRRRKDAEPAAATPPVAPATAYPPVSPDLVLASARRLGLDLRPGVVFDRRAGRVDLLGLLAILRFDGLRSRDSVDLEEIEAVLGDKLPYEERAGLADGFCGRPAADNYTADSAYRRRYDEGREVRRAAAEQAKDPACRGR